MKAVKKVEVVVESVAVPQVLALLERHGFPSYTMIPGAYGKGDRGESLGGVSGEFNNSYLVIVCDAERVNDLVELIRPVLKRFGGVSLVSDALWVKH
ncbi:MAG: transcriptional regulator [Gammaproteobacteria bacterium]|nr:transcriptional regulator [Gammaproteobacteria bacterium]